MKRWAFNSFLFLLSWFAEDPTKRPKGVVDVGCGIGGSSRYIASKFGAKCQGITLSPVQAQRANALAAAQGLSNKMLWNNHFLMGNLIWCGPWRVVNTCLTKKRFFVSLIVPSQQVLFKAFSFDLEN
nr:putative tocopherol o-methyltransferase, chloroplastic [Quercus suber]